MVIAMVPIAWAQWLIAERELRESMKSKGRFIDWSELRAKLEAGEGTLLKETGQKGPYRAWWTPDDVLAKGTLPATKEEFIGIISGKQTHLFNTKCFRDYLDPDAGKAMLTTIRPGQMRSGRLVGNYPNAKIAELIRPFTIGQVPNTETEE